MCKMRRMFQILKALRMNCWDKYVVNESWVVTNLI